MKRKSNFVMKDVGGECLLVPIGSRVKDMNGIVTMNATGKCVWELLSEEHSVDDLVAIIAGQFDVDFERARADVRAFVNKIKQIGLLE